MHHSRLFSLLLLALMAAAPLLPTGVSQAQGGITVSLSPAEVGVAETAVVEARITCPAGSCAGVNVTLNFDRAVIRVLNITPGPVLGAQPLESLKAVDNALGTVQYVASGSGGSGDLLFSLEVGGLIPGSAAINVAALGVTDANGALLVATGTGTSVTVLETGKIAFFSPPVNGWEVAFTSERDGNPEVYAASADGSAVRRLTDNPALDGGPTWSPDGGRLAFHSARDGNLEIYVMASDGSNVQRLTDNPASDSDPAWSPDSSRLLFVSDRDGSADIYVMNADGSNVQRLTTDAGVDTYPAWSPDGREIAFSASRGGSVEMYLMNADGTNVRQITNLFGANGWYPSWSPNNGDLALSVERDGAADMYRLDRQGQNVVQLTEKSDWLSSSDWSPDGGWIAYMAAPGGNKDVLVMDNQGQYVFRITNDAADDYDPDWRATAPPVVAEPCTITTQTVIEVRVGPGRNRGVFTSLPVAVPVLVEGQATDADGGEWWKLDKSQIPGHEQVDSLWVEKTVVQTSGDCSLVQVADAPPVVISTVPQNPGGWGQCGSCTTCGYAASECVLSPEGQCLWDPSTCAYVPPDPGCANVTLLFNGPAGYGLRAPAVRSPKANCGSGFTPGTPITLYAFPANIPFTGWTGTCPISGTTNPITFTITSSCTAIANYG
jgi:Tol biopolymer transport system component